jgi:hypothetical protein
VGGPDGTEDGKYEDREQESHEPEGGTHEVQVDGH